MLALKYASVGFVTVFRNVAPFVALPLEHFFQEKVVVDVWTGVALLTIMGGIIIYVWGDANVTGLGVFLTLLNLVFAVVQRVIERRMLAIKPIDVSKSGAPPAAARCAALKAASRHFRPPVPSFPSPPPS